MTETDVVRGKAWAKLGPSQRTVLWVLDRMRIPLTTYGITYGSRRAERPADLNVLGGSTARHAARRLRQRGFVRGIFADGNALVYELTDAGREALGGEVRCLTPTTLTPTTPSPSVP